MTKEQIEEIRKKYSHYGTIEKLHSHTAVKDIRLLLEEVDELQFRLDMLNK